MGVEGVARGEAIVQQDSRGQWGPQPGLATWVREVGGGQRGQEALREPSGVSGPDRRPVSPVSVEEPEPQSESAWSRSRR